MLVFESTSGKWRSLPSPLIPCGFHVIPHGFRTFHMEYVLAVIPLNLVIPFHLYSTWIPCGMAIFHSYSIIPYGISKWNPPGAVVEYIFHQHSIYSMWNINGFHPFH